MYYLSPIEEIFKLQFYFTPLHLLESKLNPESHIYFGPRMYFGSRMLYMAHNGLNWQGYAFYSSVRVHTTTFHPHSMKRSWTA